ncbi:bacillithiol biosynthesis deacetylase BshB2 [Cytobacillus sp. S13-E01]|uniref:bacillithiol biosynthesis deacetylase BshB2 n=1 Tax=Cytobacillus sp. S13-E01 TaxID=3031326 RepID=UPI0023D8C1F3|nr:bacillithiol biosynthesis deacetylase BshB2 [Cytobacillus sp. S13-E01]MDF0725644.1 bacillithiol biosynthesis deacetylase BshB2 [Cytobacillus sp. S13-E01]
MERHILVVFPHPDDEAFGSAGFIATQTRKGVPITYACATLGEMGRNMGKPFFANRETLPDIRRKELQDACKVMGIDDLRMLGFRDKTLEFEAPNKLSDVVAEIIDDVNPSLVITFYPGHGVHPDHDACGEAVIDAISKLPMDKRPVVYCKAITKNVTEVLGEPDLEFDVSDVLDVKIAAMEAHRSQTEGLLSRMKETLESGETEVMNWLKRETFWIYPTFKGQQ